MTTVIIKEDEKKKMGCSTLIEYVVGGFAILAIVIESLSTNAYQVKNTVAPYIVKDLTNQQIKDEIEARAKNTGVKTYGCDLDLLKKYGFCFIKTNNKTYQKNEKIFCDKVVMEKMQLCKDDKYFLTLDSIKK